MFNKYAKKVGKYGEICKIKICRNSKKYAENIQKICKKYAEIYKKNKRK